MSLVGSLEDLGLGEILQIVSLSRKSGLLVLRSETRRGRIVMVEGQVRGGWIEGAPASLYEVLVDGGFVAADDFKRAADAAAVRRLPLEEVLAGHTGMAIERIVSVLREQVEQAVLEMLCWRTGEFSFEVREANAPLDGELRLATGINAQYFAMEATRLRDEKGRGARPPASRAGAPDDEPVFSGERMPVEPEVRPPAERPRVEPEVRRPAERPPLVAIDRELAVLEWLKQTLDGMFGRIHIFQDSEAGVARIRQYLSRAVRPVVVLGAGPGERASCSALAQRLRALASGMPVLLLCEPRANGAAHTAGGVPLLPRPPRLRAGVPAAALEEAADQVRRAIAAWLERAIPTRPRPAAPMPGPALEDLRHVSRRLRDPTTRGEVMALVLDFAARCFARVAIFMVRDGKAVGMAQRGLPGGGGPDDAELRRIQLPLSGPGGPACFRRAIGRRTPCVARADDPGDRGLLALLGDPVPAEAWVAPIESGGGVAALLYADNLARPLPLADATALEIVLQEAGLALDRALLERALADLEGRRDGA